MNTALPQKIILEKIFNFHGGVHPEDNKQQTSGNGIIDAAIPKELIVPLQQHIGAPAKSIVKVGDKVLKGQLIAEAKGFVSVPVHAPSSGKITAIEDRPVQHPSGLAGLCIVIECDGLDQWCELKAITDFPSLSKQELISVVRNAGIAGMGGAGFPSAVKITTKDKQIETLILNSVECEPYITADDVLIQKYAAEILQGLDILNHIIQAKEILIGIEDNKPQAIAAYKQAINESQLDNIKLAIVPTKYPSGGEKQLIQLLTGKEVPSGGLPSDLGIVCCNTGTVFAIYEAIKLGKPLISRITTLTGKALAKPQNYRALIGTPFKDLLNAAEVNWGKLNQLIMGGPMMGFSVDTPDVPLVKTSNCILATVQGELTDPELEQACIRCGSCAEVCPANLLPQQLYWYSKAKELEKTEQYHLADCIECGACSYVCPSNIPLVQYFRFAKGETRNKNSELKKAELSRERFEARKARLEREEAEKEAKRLAKAEERKIKKVHQDNNDPTNSHNDALDIALQVAKTNAAKATKQWKEAEKALEAARKREENLKEYELQVKSLELSAQAAQEAFKIALANKKNVSENKTHTSTQNTLEQAIEDIREQSTQASLHLKNLKKALLSAKTGAGDSSELEKKVEQAKTESDTLKSKLRDLLQEQKASISNPIPTAESKHNKSTDQIKKESPQQELNFSENNDHENKKNKLKIEMAQIKAQTKKLNAALVDCDNNTRQEIELLLRENQKKLDAVIEKMTSLNSNPNNKSE